MYKNIHYNIVYNSKTLKRTYIFNSKMRRQRNTQKMKEQGKNAPELTNEEEIGSLPEK